MKHHTGFFRIILSLFIQAALCAALASAAYAANPLAGLAQSDFEHLSSGGFGDSANSYAWGVTGFKGDLYVGVNRHHLWSLLQGINPLLDSLGVPVIDLVEGPASEIWGDYLWAEDFRGAIWRYRNGEWSMVHQARILKGILPIASNPTLPPAPTIDGYYPESYGYRNLTVYQGYLYAIGIGTWVPNMPLARILRSSTGDPGSWEDVSGIIATATNPRGLIEYKGNLYISASLPGTAPAGAGAGLVYRFNPTSPGLWEQVSEPGFGNGSNVEIPELAVFNGYLYASTVNHTTGFEVWKTNASMLPGGKYTWKRIIKDGFGDTWNQWGMTMQPFNGYLYIGTACGGGMVLKNNQPVGSRPFDVIRLDRYDRAKLLVGAYKPSDPPAGWPKYRVPISGWSEGFSNPFNVYVWSMSVHDGWLYLGTFDEISPILLSVIELLKDIQGGSSAAGNGNIPVIDELKKLLAGDDPRNMSPAQKIMLQQLQLVLGNGTMNTAPDFIRLTLKTFGGADLWKTRDGIHWVPVTLNGFDNCLNFGIRRLTPVQEEHLKGLVVGTANPFTGYAGGGCEILFAE